MIDCEEEKNNRLYAEFQSMNNRFLRLSCLMIISLNYSNHNLCRVLISIMSHLSFQMQISLKLIIRRCSLSSRLNATLNNLWWISQISQLTYIIEESNKRTSLSSCIWLSCFSRSVFHATSNSRQSQFFSTSFRRLRLRAVSIMMFWVSVSSIVSISLIISKSSIISMSSVISKSSIMSMSSIISKSSIMSMSSIISKSSVMSRSSVVSKSSIMSKSSVMLKSSVMSRSLIVFSFVTFSLSEVMSWSSMINFFEMILDVDKMFAFSALIKAIIIILIAREMKLENANSSLCLEKNDSLFNKFNSRIFWIDIVSFSNTSSIIRA